MAGWILITPRTALTLILVFSFQVPSMALCGDCDGDGSVTILDALAAAHHGAGIITLVGQQFTDCDVNSTAQVDVLDALILAQAAAGLGVTLNCGMAPVNQPPVLTIEYSPALDRAKPRWGRHPDPLHV